MTALHVLPRIASLNVHLVSDGLKVPRVRAGAVSAQVVEFAASGNTSPEKSIGNGVCRVGLLAAGKPPGEHPIAGLFGQRSTPNPAPPELRAIDGNWSILRDLRPEPLFHRCAGGSCARISPSLEPEVVPVAIAALVTRLGAFFKCARRRGFSSSSGPIDPVVIVAETSPVGRPVAALDRTGWAVGHAVSISGSNCLSQVEA